MAKTLILPVSNNGYFLTLSSSWGNDLCVIHYRATGCFCYEEKSFSINFLNEDAAMLGLRLYSFMVILDFPQWRIQNKQPVFHFVIGFCEKPSWAVLLSLVMHLFLSSIYIYICIYTGYIYLELESFIVIARICTTKLVLHKTMHTYTHSCTHTFIIDI